MHFSVTNFPNKVHINQTSFLDLHFQFTESAANDRIYLSTFPHNRNSQKLLSE